jgi:hypothetical protein
MVVCPSIGSLLSIIALLEEQDMIGSEGNFSSLQRAFGTLLTPHMSRLHVLGADQFLIW